MAYADYYERALTNGVLSIQRGTEPGIMIYFLPMNPGGSKAVSGQGGWGTPTASFWCCYGTGPSNVSLDPIAWSLLTFLLTFFYAVAATESFSKLGDSIYFEEEGAVPTLYVIQFISSTLNWRSGELTLQQNTQQVSSLDDHFRVQFTVASANKVIQQHEFYAV
ncbi:hypothetical protein C4D60_Mb07t26560 [Musa balbisiana]|uniref:Non-reducing end beta-L-arabinofuranosidase-like GH127 catalytic domain-containing protein n=1 Tax=Musa balbisiana TaxID=52838 RepID=A0A4S8JI69_MUSBA|nr:hypothetical protein C4D60_Mb07t26560 [Musa balbisiana]